MGSSDGAAATRGPAVDSEPAEASGRLRCTWRALAAAKLLQVTPVTVAMFAVQTVAFGFEGARAVLGGAGWSALTSRLVFAVVLTYVGIAALFQLMALVLGRWRVLTAITNVVLVVLYCGLLAYRLLMGRGIDYVVIADNISDLLAPGAISALIARVGVSPWVGLGGLIAVLALIEWRLRWLSSFAKPPRRWLAVCVSIGLLTSACALPGRGELSALAHEALRFHLGGDLSSDVGDLADKRFPYLQMRGKAASGPRERPHVFIVMVESFNAFFVERRTAKGRSITPVFDELIKRGLYVERFYGNSIQSTRGTVATLCSILPSYRKKISASHAKLRMDCLPRVLRRVGYRTLFYSGMESLSLDHMGDFIKRLGFEHVQSADKSFISAKEKKKHVWGWGLADDVFYRKVLADLDKRQREKPGPMFTVLATTSNHIPFDGMPAALQKLYPGTKNKRERYENSLHFADEALGKLIVGLGRRGWLKNSVIVVVGDHSMPRGEHKIWYNELGSWEELFRTPLLVLAPGRVSPARVKRVAYSQIDIAPTILERIGYEPARTHFLGKPIREKPKLTMRQRPVYMVQPYDGTYLVTVQLPFKYVRHQRPRRDYLYNIETDPHERANLAKSKPAVVERMRALTRAIRLNQLLVEKNRIWPPKTAQRDNP